MEEKTIRLLKAEEIECRVATVKETGVSLLLYKDARVDQKILDETFGIYGWQRSHEEIKGNMYCTVSVRNDETGEWIKKQDVGKSGNYELEKSEASDSFKRACTNLGIGRELYSAPFIWIPADRTSIVGSGDKRYCSDRFIVKKIDYNSDREITELVIVNQRTAMVVFNMTAKPSSKGNVKDTNSGKTHATDKDNIIKALTKKQKESLQKELDRTGVDIEKVQERYGISDPNRMSALTYKKVMRALEISAPKDKAA